MRQILTVGCSVILALIVLNTYQVANAPSGLTIVKAGQAFAADMPPPPPPPPVAAPVGKGKAPILGKAKAKAKGKRLRRLSPKAKWLGFINDYFATKSATRLAKTLARPITLPVQRVG